MWRMKSGHWSVDSEEESGTRLPVFATPAEMVGFPLFRARYRHGRLPVWAGGERRVELRVERRRMQTGEWSGKWQMESGEWRVFSWFVLRIVSCVTN